MNFGICRLFLIYNSYPTKQRIKCSGYFQSLERPSFGQMTSQKLLLNISENAAQAYEYFPRNFNDAVCHITTYNLLYAEIMMCRFELYCQKYSFSNKYESQIHIKFYSSLHKILSLGFTLHLVTHAMTF